VSVFGVGLELLSAVGVAGPIYGETGHVENLLVSLSQEGKQECRVSIRLVCCPHDLSGEGEDPLEEPRAIRLVVFGTAREMFRARGVEHVRPVGLLSSVYTCSSRRLDFDHHHLRPSHACLFSECPADDSLYSEFSPVTKSGQDFLQRGRGVIPFKPSDGTGKLTILGLIERHSGTVPERQTQS